MELNNEIKALSVSVFSFHDSYINLTLDTK